MAAGTKVAVDFDKIIQTDRARRKNEALAKEVFSRGRRQSAPNAGTPVRKAGSGPSLASRVGINKGRLNTFSPKPTTAAPKFGKKALPAGNVNADWTHDLHGVSNPRLHGPSAPNSKNAKFTRKAHLNNLLNSSASSPNLNSQFNIASKASSGLSIRGIAGPTTVQAQNFAPGTTAADIESAMTTIGGKILKCSIIGTRPSVIAEIVFESREGANCVIDTFHNQTADGRVLNLFVKPNAVATPQTSTPVPTASAAPAIPLGPRADIERSHAQSTRYPDSDHYSTRDNNRDRGRNGNRNEVVDGSYGFDEDRMDTEDYDKPRALYSDNMVGAGGNRGGYRDRERGRGQGDSRDRGRGGDRGRGYR